MKHSRASLLFVAASIAACSGQDPSSGDGEVLTVTHADAGGMRGTFSSEGRTLGFETMHVEAPTADGGTSTRLLARISDGDGNALVADADPRWPADRDFTAYSPAQMQSHLRDGKLVASLLRTLEQETFPEANVADRNAIVAMGSLFAEGGESIASAQRPGTDALSTQSIASQPAGNAFRYFVMRKDAFFNGSPADHSALLVRNYVTDAAGQRVVASTYAQPNFGTQADAPGMVEKCGSEFIEGKWWIGSDAVECPGTMFPAPLYGTFGVCNSTTYVQMLQMREKANVFNVAASCLAFTTLSGLNAIPAIGVITARAGANPLFAPGCDAPGIR